MPNYKYDLQDLELIQGIFGTIDLILADWQENNEVLNHGCLQSQYNLLVACNKLCNMAMALISRDQISRIGNLKDLYSLFVTKSQQSQAPGAIGKAALQPLRGSGRFAQDSFQALTLDHMKGLQSCRDIFSRRSPGLILDLAPRKSFPKQVEGDMFSG